ncbi:MAG: hypothetical protein QXP03_04455 [Desulfurococcaceae archaeon]
MKQQLLVYSGQLEVIEYPGVVVHEGVLVKPLFIYVGDFEKAVLSGHIPVSRPTTLGAVGVVRIIEATGPFTEYTGKIYTVTPFGARGVLGVEENGLLATFTSLHTSYLDEPLLNPSPLDAIRPLIKHSVELARSCEEPVLVEGCGLVGVAVGMALRRREIEPVFYCEDARRNALGYGFTVASHISELNRKWNDVVLTSTNTASKYRISRDLDYRRLVISRLSFTSWIPVKKGISSLEVRVVDKSNDVPTSLVKSIVGDLSRGVKIYNLAGLEHSIGLFPPKGLGSIISLGA